MIPRSEYALRDNSRFPIFCSFSLFLLSLVTKRLSYSQCHTMIRFNLVQKKILIFNNGIFQGKCIFNLTTNEKVLCFTLLRSKRNMDPFSGLLGKKYYFPSIVQVKFKTLHYTFILNNFPQVQKYMWIVFFKHNGQSQKLIVFLKQSL